jgi:alpha-tubulin suppressor-like RCC1 family protein
MLLHVLNVSAALIGWGWNNQGQLGAGTTELALVPKLVKDSTELEGSRIVSLANGFFHTLALTEDGRVWSWGLGDKGQLGNGSTERFLIPQPVTDDGAWGARRILAISAGEKHSVALTEDGEVFCWGDNSNGQCGTENRSAPIRSPLAVSHGVMAGKVITKIAAGLNNTLALSSTGELFVWGAYGPGHTSDWLTLESAAPLPVEMGPLTGKTVSSLASGFGFSLVLTSDGEMFSWGSNEYGNLGDGSGVDRMNPALVPLSGTPMGTKVTAVSLGRHHALALTSVGEVFAWGYGYYGQLGIPYPFPEAPFTFRPQPSRVDFGNLLAGDRITAVEAGALHSIAVTERGRIFTWGFNNIGELGFGQVWWTQYTPARLAITEVLCGEGVKTLARAGSAFHMLALSETAPNGVPCFSSREPQTRIRFAGDPGLLYEVQIASSLLPPVNWTSMGMIRADAGGVVTFDQQPPATTSFWRVVPAGTPDSDFSADAL